MVDIKVKSEGFALVDPNRLVPHPRNNNRHPVEQIQQLAKIIEARGFREPLTVSSSSGFVVCGHGRLDAAKLLNMQLIPIIYQEFKNEAEEYQHLTADNEIARWSELDFQSIYDSIKELEIPEIDIPFLGIENFKLPEVAQIEPQTDEDAVPEVKPDPKTKRGDVWVLGKHRLLCGDSTMIDDVEKLMKGEKADMVFTDPPYNIGFKPQRGTHDIIKNDDMSDGEFKEFLLDTFTNCKAVLKPDTYLISFMGWSTVQDFNYALRDLFKIKSMPIWVKNNFGIGYYTRPKYEPFYLCLNGEPTKPDAAPADVFEFAKVYKTIHSCEKPVDMIIGITDHFMRGDLYYEPFLGSGSMLIAAEKTNRKCYGMELDEKYCDVIIKRWQDYTSQDAVLESTGETYNNLTGA